MLTPGEGPAFQYARHLLSRDLVEWQLRLKEEQQRKDDNDRELQASIKADMAKWSAVLNTGSLATSSAAGAKWKPLMCLPAPWEHRGSGI